jgi:formamidopyrimidine-DNA glycosylase
MPELPEVETIRRDLEELVTGQVIRAVEVLDPRLVRYPEPAEFIASLRDRRLAAARRRAKYLLLDLVPAATPLPPPALSRDWRGPGGLILVIQLILSGQLLLLPPDAPRRLDTRLVLRLSDELTDPVRRQLQLVDQSGLAIVHLGRPDELAARLPLDELGPEPIDPTFTLDQFAALLAQRRGAIRSLLLDQRFISGVGTIYADEALFAAAIHPTRPANSLQPDEVARLYEALRAGLLQGITDRGTTTFSYLDVYGQPGKHQERLQVVTRAGRACPRCGARIVKSRIGGAPAYFCPSCQK